MFWPNYLRMIQHCIVRESSWTVLPKSLKELSLNCSGAINWSKTFFMVINNRRIKIPESFTFANIEIKCVNEFKLPGITIDNKPNSNTHVSNLSHCIRR